MALTARTVTLDRADPAGSATFRTGADHVVRAVLADPYGHELCVSAHH